MDRRCGLLSLALVLSLAYSAKVSFDAERATRSAERALADHEELTRRLGAVECWITEDEQELRAHRAALHALAADRGLVHSGGAGLPAEHVRR